MKYILIVLSALCLGSISGLSVFASVPQSQSNLMQIEDVRAGMKGYGMTVFQGSKPERFEVEVLGILKGVPNPKQCSVIARLSGPLVDRTGVFAGMSGSPVYIDGKLVGAVAFTFPFSKEPIAGITPIKYMIENFDRGKDQQPGTGKNISFNTLIARANQASGPVPAGGQPGLGDPNAMAGASGSGSVMIPIATPVSFSGIPQPVIDYFAGDLKKLGIQPIAGVSGGSSLSPMADSNGDTLTPGSSVNVELVRGDFTIDAAGTVTYRDEDRIYAFGHPFLSSGVTSWPMAESSVITVVPNVNNSFKLATGGNLVGSINQDRSTGIFGQLGSQPRMIPVHITVHTSRDKTEKYNFEIVCDTFLSPLLMKLTTFAAVTATERQLGSQTINLVGHISVDGQPDVSLDNAFSTANGAIFQAVAAVEKPLAILMNSGFEKLNVKGIQVDVTSSDTRSSGTLNRLWVDKTEVRRGETIEVQAFARNDNGTEFVERIPLTIPSDAPIGPLVIMVGDGASMNQTEARGQGADFVPKDLGQLVRAMNKLKKNNRLYVRIVRAGGGAIVNSEEMPTLPPSVLATLGSQRTSGGYTPLSYAIMSENELPPSQFIINGQESMTINVVR
ncbi:MAG TPA: SpoIVB peptidase S55 domain-containing protein [Blastocatellia bacterium]|nr:SpoIVB peptidase S55 domain-containing protein [Blastocatellia bacterium]